MMMNKKMETCLRNLFGEGCVQFIKKYLQENKLKIMKDESIDEFLKVYLEAEKLKIVKKYPDRKGVDSRASKKEVWLPALAKRLTGSEKYSWVDGENVWYLGAGYWRVTEGDDGLGTFWLINPSLSHEQIDTVERALNILSF